MKIVFHTNILSPHQVPWCRELVNLFSADLSFVYVTREQVHSERIDLGWSCRGVNFQVIPESQVQDLLVTCDVLISGVRDVCLFERRLSAGCATLYMSERWFKPPLGMLRLLSPSYFRMAWRLVRLLRGTFQFLYLPIGVYAAQDMARLCGLFNGDWRCLFRSPVLRFEHKPMELIFARNPKNEMRYCLHKMRLWGYFVEPSLSVQSPESTPPILPIGERNSEPRVGKSAESPVRILWVGRMLGWKRVDILIAAVKILLSEGNKVELKLVGIGPEEYRLRKLANGIDSISFQPPVPIMEVRALMQNADVYVLPSNGFEGWGAVVNEAMTEGCLVVATHEAGGSATLIEDGVNGLLFDSGDVDGLASCLKKALSDEHRMRLASTGRKTIDEAWSPLNAAKQLALFCNQNLQIGKS